MRETESPWRWRRKPATSGHKIVLRVCFCIHLTSDTQTAEGSTTSKADASHVQHVEMSYACIVEVCKILPKSEPSITISAQKFAKSVIDVV